MRVLSHNLVHREPFTWRRRHDPVGTIRCDGAIRCCTVLSMAAIDDFKFDHAVARQRAGFLIIFGVCPRTVRVQVPLHLDC